MRPNRFYSAFDEETMSLRVRGESEYRNAFQIDRDRIIHSSAFRRLQNKTQVFLSGEYDFYRTRLTHSIEVAQIGRSICAYLQQSELLAADFFIDPDLVEGACLAHDLGHPPFGHTGERVLHEMMKPYGGFEGNAQTLRLLTETLFADGQHGMDPSRALLDGVLKYKTLLSETPDAKNHYLYDDQERFLDFTLNGDSFPLELTPGKARNSFRSIECQIMDWADDTAYSVNDVADGIRASFINVQSLERWASGQSLNDDAASHVEFLCKAIREHKVEPRLNRLIGGCIRAGKLVPAANFLSLSSRRHAYALEIDPAIRAQTEVNKKIALDLVFLTPALQQMDYKASFILESLFKLLRERYIEGDGKGLHLMPKEVEQQISQAPDKRLRARLVCDWIANMTDNFAFRTYRRLFDPQFGSITDLV
ncbi:MAG: deoxyguanosinetriphosphate triphosphohydrolase [Verrucomicrobiaceae bacterium]|nr:deoxyguanosinetriphosphate triphosphohydrolase [Verrucomicrobiaceae bacterium]